MMFQELFLFSVYAADVCFTGSHHEWCQYGCCDNRCCAYTYGIWEFYKKLVLLVSQFR